MALPSEVDLLVFGPHPDDIEIGLAGTVALHAALGFRVGLCDLTRGELGSNGTPEEREAEAEAARAVLGAAWRVNLKWPDGGIDGHDGQIADVVRLMRACRPRAVALPYWNDRHPDHRAASEALTPRRVQERAAAVRTRRRAGLARRLDLLLLHQRRRRPSRSPSTSPRTTRSSARRSPATGRSSRRRRPTASPPV